MDDLGSRTQISATVSRLALHWSCAQGRSWAFRGGFGWGPERPRGANLPLPGSYTLRIIGPSELEGFDPAERRGLDLNQTFTDLSVLDP